MTLDVFINEHHKDNEKITKSKIAIRIGKSKKVFKELYLP